MKKILVILSAIFSLAAYQSNAQCDQYAGTILQTNNPIINLADLARKTAPMLWFSPDEPYLYDENKEIRIPMALPVDEPGNKPVVYYKLTYVYSMDRIDKEELDYSLQEVLHLDILNGFDLNFYYYFDKETGVGSHKHDIESMSIQFNVIQNDGCPEGKYSIVAQLVVAHAHGLVWYQNVFVVDEQTFFPLSIMIGEGKHASCTDKNADGVYTPGFDVSENVNDAWGVRDIETSGRLFTGQYQAWMTKKRTKKSLLFPPIAREDRYYDNLIDEFKFDEDDPTYELRAYPNYLEIDVPEDLVRFMKDKKPHDWPKPVRGKADHTGQRNSQTVASYKAISFAYRWDNSNGISITLPLLLFKNVEAPMTGGWLYHKIYFGNEDAFDGRYENIFGHQIVHTPSASRWLDPYIGMGYEIYDKNDERGVTDYSGTFVSEIGFKLRLNVSHTPLKFLKYLGTSFWGVRMGWKNVGFDFFKQSGFVVELGAGVF